MPSHDLTQRRVGRRHHCARDELRGIDVAWFRHTVHAGEVGAPAVVHRIGIGQKLVLVRSPRVRMLVADQDQASTMRPVDGTARMQNVIDQSVVLGDAEASPSTGSLEFVSRDQQPGARNARAKGLGLVASAQDGLVALAQVDDLRAPLPTSSAPEYSWARTRSHT